ncbi:MAG: 4Fe-4S dicluster domain-containing protein [Candidatus Ranarchaeia archaeon]|jgi:Fe-S-cluster-containing dehydrogenase component
MKKKPPKPKAIWVVSPTLGKTRFPVCSASTYIDWDNGTPMPGKTKFSRFTTDCTRCRSCEIICAFFREKVNNPSFSRIRVETNEIEWIEGKTEKIVERKICRQCPGIPECMLACPVEGALYRNPETGVVLVNFELCINCKSCVDACPYDAIWHNEQADKILKCDTCDGKPKCVMWCPVECLKLERIL